MREEEGSKNYIFEFEGRIKYLEDLQQRLLEEKLPIFAKQLALFLVYVRLYYLATVNKGAKREEFQRNMALTGFAMEKYLDEYDVFVDFMQLSSIFELTGQSFGLVALNSIQQCFAQEICRISKKIKYKHSLETSIYYHLLSDIFNKYLSNLEAEMIGKYLATEIELFELVNAVLEQK